MYYNNSSLPNESFFDQAYYRLMTKYATSASATATNILYGSGRANFTWHPIKTALILTWSLIIDKECHRLLGYRFF